MYYNQNYSTHLTFLLLRISFLNVNNSTKASENYCIIDNVLINILVILRV